MTLIEVNHVEKYYGTYHALKDISLNVEDGEFIALVGPSGCGKTSLLKILAGFEDLTEGALHIEGRSMVGVPPSQRPTRMVFQKLALFPHKTIYDNIAFPLRIAKVDATTIKTKVDEMIELMHLKPEYLTRFPAQLSGGEQQRVALARAMVSGPSVLLLDEPLSALDVKLKKSLQTELKRLHRIVGTTFVHVTHDLEEAMMLADRICVMRAGEVLQVGTPDEIYYRPATEFVSGFIGETNLIDCEVTRSGDTAAFKSETIAGACEGLAAAQVAPAIEGGAAKLMVRPEKIDFAEGDHGLDCTLDGKVEEFFKKGATTQYRVRLTQNDQLIFVELPGAPDVPKDVGDPVTLGFNRADVYILKADSHAG